MNKACMSDIKDPENRSKKDCCCGGHNHSNVKRNLNHNSTAKKLSYRKSKKAKQEYLEDMRNKETYDSIHYCNKCGKPNNVVVKDKMEGLVLEAETTCIACGFFDYWATGFFQSRQEGFNKSEKY